MDFLPGVGRAVNAPEFAAYRKGPAFAADYDLYLDRMDEALTVGRLPFPESLDALNQWSEQVKEANTKDHIIRVRAKITSDFAGGYSAGGRGANDEHTRSGL